jgi:uncharacterized alkaline shock family protein YloU
MTGLKVVEVNISVQGIKLKDQQLLEVKETKASKAKTDKARVK